MDTVERTPAPRPERTWSVAGLLLVVVLALADTFVGPHGNLSATFAIAPFLTATAATPRLTAAIGAVAAGASVALTLRDEVSGAAGTIRVLVVVFSTLLAVYAAHRRTVRERHLAAVARVAEIAQQAILVPVPARLGGFSFASAYVSATDEAQLGGDFYELVETRYGIRLVLGDVRGKGVEGVRLAALVLRYFRDSALTCEGLEEATNSLDRLLTPHLGLEEFVTALLVQLNDGVVELVNCGHHPPAIVAPAFRWLHDLPSTTPLGLRPEPRCARVRLAPGDRVLLYTDGLAEARQPDGTFVTLEELASNLDRRRDLSEAVREVMRRLHARIAGRLGDDLALLLIEYTGRPRR